MGEPLAAVLALERLLPGVNPLVLLQVVLELEGFAAMGALELAEVRPVLMVCHVALQLTERGELLVAQATRLQKKTTVNFTMNLYNKYLHFLYYVDNVNRHILFLHISGTKSVLYAI